ncbi:hypothetical protein AGDE_14456 [Angomonas deanei]|uniref:Uncharacterized protein n=1 Tax=Angomonas deanei TaxID=59799 RepID=A0A7G2CWH0_9TRYP|nr:hypothetical protein AGDE_14456 [Angomonas deanei]CAD2222773.1 hypothetical protein, conserved [Angomonas deanei]|eukprot:EPY20828.1 hypothetical protein AGDE_14456 [Angomonas deanei]
MVMNYATHIHTLLQTNWIDVVRQNNDNIHNNNNDLVMKEKEEEEESEWVFYTREEDTLLHDDNDNNTFDLSSECHRGAFYLSSLLLQHQKNNNHHTNTMKEEDRILWEVELTSASLRVMFLNKETTDNNNNNPKIERLYQEFILEENSNNTEEEDITHHNNNKKEEDGEKIDLIVGLEGITLRLTEYAHRPRRLCMTLKELYCYTFTAETEQTAVTVTPNPQSPEKKKSTSTSLFSTKTALSFAKSFTTSVVKSAVKHTVTTNLDSFLQQQSANKKRVQYRRSYLLSLCETSPTDWRDYSGGTRMIIEWRTPLQQEVDRLTALSAYLNGAPSLSLWLTLQPVHLQFDGNHATHLLSFLTRVKRALYHAVAPDGILEDLFLPPPLYFDTVHLAPTTLYLTTSLSGSESVVEQLPLFFSASYTELEDTNHQKSWWSASLQTALAAASTMPCQLRNLSIKVPSVTCVHTDSTRLAEVFLERLKSTTASVQSLLWSHFGGDVMPLSQRALDRSIDLAAQQYRRAAEYWKSKPQQQ